MASIGQTVGFADYTSFMATDKYIKENPEVLQVDQRHRQGDEVDGTPRRSPNS